MPWVRGHVGARHYQAAATSQRGRTGCCGRLQRGGLAQAAVSVYRLPTMDFFERLTAACKAKDTLLCVGLDPRLDPAAPAASLLEANRRLIGETAEYAACFKPNIAFFEAAGPKGLEALERTLELIPADTPVLIDAKRGDIGSTAEAYAAALFGRYRAGAVTLSPYLGRSSVEPFLAYRDRGLFLLSRTSNPGADCIQKLTVRDSAGRDEPLYLHLARECASWGPQVALVVAGNDPEALAAVRSALPEVWILAPGIGAQGGTAEEAVEAGVRADGLGLLPVVVRAIADDPHPARRAAAYRDAINQARERLAASRGGLSRRGIPPASAGADLGVRPASAAGRRDETPGADRQEILKGLIDSGCFRLGEFVLKSGITSPFYVDLRRASSDPILLRKIARAYAELLRSIRCDRIAGIPVAALPLATAVSLETGIPLIYPRITAKGHGTGNPVEGIYRPGERVVLLDDLITTGQSKIEASAVLTGAGLIVTDLVVLLERGAGGGKELAEAGITLHAYAQISELFTRCRELGLVDAAKERELVEFVGRSQG